MPAAVRQREALRAFENAEKTELHGQTQGGTLTRKRFAENLKQKQDYLIVSFA